MRIFSIAFLITLTSPCFGQQLDSLSTTYSLQEVTVIGNRLKGKSELLPLASTTVDSSLLSQPVQQLSIKEQLLMVPGVYVQNAYNFAQDARISVRGFGANAPFGIRGIKLMVDGIPETTPDGTGQLDNLHLDQVGSIQVLRGASSSLYGNASGGAILINSSQVQRDFLTYQGVFGSYGFYSQALSGGIKTFKGSYQANVRAFGTKGFRDHNTVQQINARFATHQQFSKKLSGVFIAELVDSPKAQDPGGLTLEDTESDFRQARDRNLTFDAGEAITQWKLGSSLKWQLFDASNLNTYAFYNQRVFDGRLPFENAGVIDLKRDYFGVGNALTMYKEVHTLNAGYDLLVQEDKRRRFDNLEGTQGPLAFDQEERFFNAGFYVIDQIEWRSWFATGGLRFDHNKLSVDDRFITNGDESGDINMNNWSYQLGVGHSITNELQVFANHSTSFETPTLIQLSNRPDNQGGFEDLSAANAINFELGIRWKSEQLSAEVVGFVTETKSELVPYELEETPDRTFFRNAGETNRRGLEAALTYQSKLISVHATYTLPNFEFDNYVEEGTDLSGFKLPGVPQQFAALNLSLSPISQLSISLPTQFVGSMWADSGNETEIDSYIETSLLASYELKVEKVQIAPFLGIRNLTDQRYFDNVRISAFGSRFYEPAPGRNFYAGVKISI